MLAWLVSKGALPIHGARRREKVREYPRAMYGLPEWALQELDRASERYLSRWGRTYRALQWLRLAPCWAQYAVLRLVGDV